MRKRKIEVLFLLQILFLIIPSVNAQDEIKHFKFNYGGYGIPYGGIPGFNFEINPIQYIGLSGGLGYNELVGVGWSVGARLYFVSQGYKVRPHLNVYRGVVATIVNWPDYEHGIGNAYGAGIELRISTTMTVEFGVHYIDLKLPEGYKDLMPGWRVVSFGIGYCF